MIFIAENLRRLRLARGLTQEELAASLGVSGQAVSRWETGSVCPDIELLPGLANLFNVSLDELCGMVKLRAPGTLRRIFDEECSKRASGDIQGAVEALRAGLRLFPDEPGLLGELALNLTLAGEISEATGVSERLLGMNCPRKIAATTAANLVWLYKSGDEPEKARALALTLPHLRECRELALMTLDGDRASAVRETLRTLCELISSPEPTATLAKGLTSDLSDDEMLEALAEILRTDAAR